MDSVVITSHFLNQKICDNLLIPITSKIGSNREFFLLYHSDDEIVIDVPIKSENIIKLCDRNLSKFSQFYKNAWFSITEKYLYFYSLFNSFENYWFIEYDISYSGDEWSCLLDSIDEEFKNTDLISSGNCWRPSPDWFAYNSLEGISVPKNDLVASFVFMSRISNALFAEMLSCKDEQSGYCELYLPVFSKMNDFTSAFIPPRHTSPIWAPHLKINDMSYEALKDEFPDKLFHSISYR
jgi:hypothetical protein